MEVGVEEGSTALEEVAIGEQMTGVVVGGVQLG